MAEQLDLEAVVRFTAEGQQAVRAAIGGVQRELDALHKTGKITDATHDHLATTLTKTGQAADRQLGRGAQNAGAAIQKMGSAAEEANGNLIRQRYALYDVATTYGAVSVAALAAVTATTTFAARYESAFSAVERTTLQANGAVAKNIGGIRQELYDLSTQIPIAFDELSRIASLGAQLGVPTKDLDKFTETIAKFSATTNVSIEEAALAFGRLGNLLNVPASQYDRLGSAIALVGVNSASTETEIISIAKELAPAAAAAGFTADQVIALSGALGSLGVPPERSRSTILQFFETLNTAVAQGGTKLQNFAKVVGVSASELESMVRSGQGKGILERFIGNVSTSDTVEITQALEELGLAGLRTNPTIRALAGNTKLLDQAFQDASQGFSENTFLDQAFSKVLEDATSQLALLSNAFTNFLSVAGGPFLGFLKNVVPPAIAALKAITDFAQSPIGSVVFGWAGSITLLVGVLFAYRSMAALAMASSYAMATAFGTAATGTVTLRGGVINLIGSLLGLQTASGKAATGAAVLKGSLLALGRATIIVGAIQLIVEALAVLGSFLNDVDGSLKEWRSTIVSIADILSPIAGMWAEAAKGVRTFAASIGSTFPALSGFSVWLQTVARDFQNLMLNVNGGVFGAAVDGLGRVGRASGRAASAQAAASRDSAKFAKELGNVGSAAGGAAREVRTLVDYASDLRGVFSRAFDIRFSKGLAMDEVADSWATLSDRIQEAKNKLASLQADRAIKEFFLSVANQFGDTLRAGVLGAEIADLNKEIAEAQADASTTLKGNTKGARDNRKTLADLVKKYQDYITSLAESGADQKTLNAAIARSKAEFLAQAKALGFSNAQLKPYIASFADMAQIIAKVPRNITVRANVDPALQALNEFAAKARSAGVSAGNAFNKGLQAGAGRSAKATELQSQLLLLQKSLANAIARGADNYALRYMAQIKALSARLRSGNYAEGGYTGRGGKHQPAGVVHRGEYVIPKEQVNQRTGLPYADALGNLQRGTQSSGGYARGGHVGGDAMYGVMELGQATISRIAQAVAPEVALYVDSKEIARAANKGNQVLQRQGTR